MRKKGIIKWILYALLIIITFSAFVSGDIVSGIFLLIAAVIVAPIQPVRELRNKIKFGRLLAGVVAALMIIVGISSSPSETPTENVDYIVEDAADNQDDGNVAEDANISIDKPSNETTDEDNGEGVKTESIENSTFSILFIDVGQGDAALVECDGRYMLIDGGNKTSSSLIYTVLKDRKIECLDIIVGTHADEDHVGGLAGALNYARADVTLCPVQEYDSKAFEDFAEYATKNGNGIIVPNVGDTYTLGSAQIEILAVNSGENSNDRSIVLKIVYKETSFLFTGDAEIITEEKLVETADISATVIKVSHHGADTSTSEEFLSAVSPNYAVISVGENNNYGHPAQNVLDRLKDNNIEVYRTDLQGDVLCVSDGTNVIFEVEKNADIDVFAVPATEEKDEIEQEPESENAPTIETETTPEPEPNPTPAPDPAPTPNPEPAPDTQPTPNPIPEPEPEQPVCNYVINTNTGKFHWPGCSSVDDMKESNKWFYTGTRESVIDMGYSPCGRCDP